MNLSTIHAKTVMLLLFAAFYYYSPETDPAFGGEGVRAWRWGGLRACGFGCGLVRGRVGRMQARDCTAVLQAERARLEEGGFEVIGAFVRVLARTG